MTAAELAGLAAGKAGVDSVESVLARLGELGLLSRVPEDPPRHTVVPVDAALDALIAARERELAAARQRAGQLAARFRRSAAPGGSPDLVEVVRGRDAVSERLEQLLNSATSEIRAMDAPPYLNPPTDPSTTELRQLRQGVRCRVIYDRHAFDIPGRLADIEDSVGAGEQARVTNLPIKLGISDQSTAMLPLRSDPVDLECWLVVHDAVVLKALSSLFELYWERAVPLRISRGRPDPATPDAPTDTDRALLPLLVAGLTDQAIADHLGWHERTAHRHLRDMMSRLDAATRFQAGYQAVRRGWLTDPDGGGGGHATG